VRQVTCLPYIPPHINDQYDVPPALQFNTVVPNAHAIRSNFNYNDVTSNAYLRVNSPTGGDAIRNDRWKTFIHLD
jgi:hypothetical protein